MSFSENMRNLRKECNMSQGDLADALEVSRQSVSKWETEGAVPELDKLMRMCDLFGVTLDELVRGEGEREREASVSHVEKGTASALPEPRRHPTAACILFGMGGVVAILITLLAGILSGLLFAMPFLLCGCICLMRTHHALLDCIWVFYLGLELWLSLSSSVSATSVVLQLIMGGFSMTVLVGLLLLLARMCLLTATAILGFLTPMRPKRAVSVLLGVAWAAYILLPILLVSVPLEPVWQRAVLVPRNLLSLALSGLLVGVSFALLGGLKKR